ncbi:hypothetical protein [Euzebya rosea]|uniref:hypothetical protein n=1 Tax=Euzebya rosea TaxID=2052804 RepID=UPI000D3EBBF2|nr:hypothetical protein [Euzebya rosea]
MPVPDVAHELFAATPAEFVQRRDALAAELRARGDRPAAAVVKALRRPTVAAAAINLLARAEPDLIEASLAAGEALASAQRRALSGVSQTDVRGAVRTHHRAIDAVLAAAPEATSWPVAVRDAVRRTLQAAAVDEELAEDVRRGTLSRAAETADPTLALTGFAPLTVVADRDSKGDRGPIGSPTGTSGTARAAEPAAPADAEEAGDAVEGAGAVEEARLDAERRRAAELALARRDLVRLRAQRDERVSSAAGARRRAARAAEEAAAADAAREQAIAAAADARRLLEERNAEVRRTEAAVRAAREATAATSAAVGPADAALADAEHALSVAQATLDELERKDR